MKWFKHRKLSLMAVSVWIGILAGASADDVAPQKFLQELKSNDETTREKTVQKVLSERKTTINKLIEIVNPTNKEEYSKITRSMAAYLLGEMRAIEAVPVLSRSLSIAANPGRSIISDGSPYDSPIITALIKIGRPATLAMIQNLETSDDRSVRIKSKLVLFYAVGGRHHMLKILKRRQDEAKDPKVVARLKPVCDKLSADIAKYDTGTKYQDTLLVDSLRFGAAAAGTTADGPSPQELAKGLKSEDEPTREKAVKGLLAERNAKVQELIKITDPANKMKHSKITRSMAAYLLGEMRAVEAVPVLSRSLSLADDPGRLVTSDRSPYDSPITTALIKIGLPAVLAMIQNLETADDPSVRVSSRLVLSRAVGRQRRVLKILQRRQGDVKDPKVVARLKRICDKLTEDIAKSKSKGFKEPLF